MQIGQTKVFGAAFSALLSQRQNIFDLVFSWTCISSPMTVL